MSNDKLAPCPFCGAKNDKHDDYPLMIEHCPQTTLKPAHRVHCDGCGATTNYTDSGHLDAWNTRHWVTVAKKKIYKAEMRLSSLQSATAREVVQREIDTLKDLLRKCGEDV